ncbi:MAG: MFS transporter, partial [Gaiellales bacterium]
MRRRLPPALQQRDFSFFWIAILGTGFAAQMMAVAIGWQVYAINESALDLGLIGLAEFLPLPLLALPAGHVADRLSRRLVFAAAIVLDCLIAGGLLAVTLAGASSLWPFLLLALAAGSAAALGWPAARSMPPTLVSADLLAGAMALRGIAFQSATIVGPAIGGLLFAAQAELVYVVAVTLLLAALGCVLAVREQAQERLPEATSREALFAGARFVRRTPVL